MGNIYIVCNSYNPNTAPINRILSFVRGFSELGVEAEVVFLTPNSVRSKVDKHYPLITFKYMWVIIKRRGALPLLRSPFKLSNYYSMIFQLESYP